MQYVKHHVNYVAPKDTFKVCTLVAESQKTQKKIQSIRPQSTLYSNFKHFIEIKGLMS